ncbi:MAG: rRNA maturation RNase YbeY [Candidatus Aminicenantes bacterium]|nr:rRNA maturation RNase YbeY [Candidatus Aminicenantes bacterium]
MVEVLNRQRAARIRVRRFERLLGRLLRRYRRGRAGVVLAFVGEKAVRRLNRTYRGQDRVTDVLSFPARPSAGGEGAAPRAAGRPLPFLGDILICVPRAARQAARLGHALEAELAFLALHGFLHLLGYEHGEGHEEEEARAAAALRRESILPFPPP